MEAERELSETNSFTSAMTLNQIGVPQVPERFILPPHERPNDTLCLNPSTTLPVIDVFSLHNPSLRPWVIDEIQLACKELGFFQVSFTCNMMPVTFHEEIEEGSQVMAVNCYPACPEPDLALGMPPHSDYGYLTILIQSQPGLQIMDNNNNWHPVPVIEGALLVQLGDQIEVMSNGRNESVLHRATLNKERTRISIASLHSLSLEKKVGPAPQLVDEEHPLAPW